MAVWGDRLSLEERLHRAVEAARGRMYSGEPMSVPADTRFALEDLVREVDLLVFKVEGEPTADVDVLVHERGEVRRELERVREQLEDLVRTL